MRQDFAFVDFLVKVRTGDRIATTQFVSYYEPVILRAVGDRLRRLGLARLYDPMDICQVVLCQFLVEFAHGHFELAASEDVKKLLAAMARNRLADVARHFETERHAHKIGINDCVYRGRDPKDALECQDLLDSVRKRLTVDEWRLACARAAGQSWRRIGQLWGVPANALRMRLLRAGRRIRRSLALDEE